MRMRSAIFRSTICPLLVAVAMALVPSVARASQGIATWYGPGFQGNVMYDGGTYDMYDPTIAASNEYPLGTWLQVTSLNTGASVQVRIRDRGGFHAPIMLDLSYAAFRLIDDPAAMQIPIEYHVIAAPGQRTRSAPPATVAAGAPANPPTQYVVQPGDTLNSIASRFGLDSAKLASWNNLIDADSIVVGQTLTLVPPSSPAPAPPPPAAPPPATGGTYVVQPGDTLASIADHFGVSVAALQQLNQLADADVLQAGQTLRLPSTTRQYVVQPGDTLDSIADHFGVTANAILKLNRLADPDLITVGTILTIPPGS